MKKSNVIQGNFQRKTNSTSYHAKTEIIHVNFGSKVVENRETVVNDLTSIEELVQDLSLDAISSQEEYYAETEITYVDFSKKEVQGKVLVNNCDGSLMAEGTEEFIKMIS